MKHFAARVRLYLSRLFMVLGVLTPLLSPGRSAAQDASPNQARLNVLFIAVDDLRPTLGCYGDKTAITPNIDALAARGTVFNRAYCQQAVCSPSRLSLMTGMRPDTIKVWDLNTHFRDAKPDTITLPQLFKDNGYHTSSIGKIYHGGGVASTDPPSWSVDPLLDHAGDADGRYMLPINRDGKGAKQSATEAADVPDNAYIDGMVCDLAVTALEDLKTGQQPFFLAVGFRKPHLPFCAPQKYWDLYDRDAIPLPANPQHPADAPEFAIRSWKELEGYADIPDDGNIPIEKVRELRHGYYACVSYTDALVGRLIDTLDRLGLTDNTIIVLWGDHGFHLGEQGLWTKANNYELATRAPLMFCIPGRATAGTNTDALVEFVDIYPTLADICGLKAPADLQGISLKTVIDNPDAPGKPAAFSQYPRAFVKNRYKGHGDVMGYAVRTQRYRYVEWREWESKKVLDRELYDEVNDPMEMTNIAADPGQSNIIDELSIPLAAGFDLPAAHDNTQP